MTSKIKVHRYEDDYSYDVLIGKGLLHKVGKIINDHIADKIVNKEFLILIGKESARLYLQDLKEALKKAGFHNIRHIIVGEEKINKICNQESIPIIVGGNKFKHLYKTLKGSIYVPTTLLGMANSAVMGHPLIAISDINLLKSIDYKYFMSGYSEIAKHAILNDLDFFEWLESHGRSIFDGDENARLYAIKKSCSIKAKYMDDKENKMMLQLGHTFSDSIEKTSKKNLLHGEAISIGLLAAFDLAQKLEFCTLDEYKRVRRHLKSMTLPIFLSKDKWDPNEIIENIDFENPIILPTQIGKVFEYKEKISKDLLSYVANRLIED